MGGEPAISRNRNTVGAGLSLCSEALGQLEKGGGNPSPMTNNEVNQWASSHNEREEHIVKIVSWLRLDDSHTRDVLANDNEVIEVLGVVIF